MSRTPESLDPQSLSPERLAQLLTAAGRRLVTADMIREDIAAGAPADARGNLNLVHYTAWLAGELGHGD